jgi:hypothetical protein
MLRKLFTVALLTGVSAAALAAAGCASSNEQPSALTGDQTTMNDNWKYTDQKGHFRPELRRDAQAQSPAAAPDKG